MNECAYYVISKAGGTPYAGAVAEKQKHLNDRWRALCQQLGITYKKAEETRYGLKLLEIQLKQLNTWMTEVESRLMGFTVTGSCILTEMQKKAKEMKVLFVCGYCLSWLPFHDFSLLFFIYLFFYCAGTLTPRSSPHSAVLSWPLALVLCIMEILIDQLIICWNY